MQRLQLYLTDEQKQRISQRAKAAGQSRAEVVRAILDRGSGSPAGRTKRWPPSTRRPVSFGMPPTGRTGCARCGLPRRSTGSGRSGCEALRLDRADRPSAGGRRGDRGVDEATALLREAVGAGAAVCSVLSRVEIEGGMRSAERTAVARLFAVLQPEAVTDLIAGRAGEFLRRYRRSHSGIDLVDYAIAATADVLDASLLTLDVEHFPMFEGLRQAF